MTNETSIRFHRPLYGALRDVCLDCGAERETGHAAGNVYWQGAWVLDGVPIIWCEPKAQGEVK